MRVRRVAGSCKAGSVYKSGASSMSTSSSPLMINSGCSKKRRAPVSKSGAKSTVSCSDEHTFNFESSNGLTVVTGLGETVSSLPRSAARHLWWLGTSADGAPMWFTRSSRRRRSSVTDVSASRPTNEGGPPSSSIGTLVRARHRPPITFMADVTMPPMTPLPMRPPGLGCASTKRPRGTSHPAEDR
jgi:hypothetical protein